MITALFDLLAVLMNTMSWKRKSERWRGQREELLSKMTVS